MQAWSRHAARLGRPMRPAGPLPTFLARRAPAPASQRCLSSTLFADAARALRSPACARPAPPAAPWAPALRSRAGRDALASFGTSPARLLSGAARFSRAGAPGPLAGPAAAPRALRALSALPAPLRRAVRGLATTAAAAESSTGTADPNAVAYWLFAIAALTYGIIVLGGLTRLTESGLSITEWNLIKGMKAPSGEEEWEAEFAKYKETPEYKVLNHHMTLPEFKRIFYYEWAHRLWGRAIGLAFILPAAWFAARGRLTRATATKVLGIGGVIGFQGALGWYMVKSGLDPEHVDGRPIPVPRVSQYRLAAHLMTAFVVYGGSMWVGLDILRKNMGREKLEALRQQLANPALGPLRRYAAILGGLVFVTAFSGALVAGLDAGLVYSEWPLMGGRVVPSDMWALTDKHGRPVDKWKNLLENPSAVQFDHRMLAYGTLAGSTALFYYGRRLPLPRSAKAALHALMALAYAQASLGIFTLIYLVPVSLASLHQAGSVAVFSAAVWLAQALKKVPVK